ncbi:MAG: DNA/RNA non-specific endonuclease, partial [Cyanobacteria bacterium J06642_9]
NPRLTMPSGAFTITESVSSDSMHLRFGNPSNATADINNPNNYLLFKDQYALSYNDSLKIANWSSWQLNSGWLGSAPRQDDFREDTSLPPGFYQVSEDDYAGSGFDRGHIIPSADRTATVADNSATFVMTNMMPQAPDNNRNTWGNLEDFSRELVTVNPNITSDDQELYVVAGSYGVGGVGSNGSLSFISTPGGNITVPDRTWKAILVLDDPGDGIEAVSFDNRVIAVDIPNDQDITSDWREFQVSVDDIEASTGLDLFSSLPDDIEASLETQVDGFATPLGAGDIAITGFNFDTPDDFSFVFLTDVLAGTEIQFTDKGVLSDGSLHSGEDSYVWRSQQDYSAGEVVIVSEAESGFTLSANGDQIIAFQGSSSNPNYLYSLNSERITGWQADATSATTSALPTGLVNGQTAIALNEIDNAIYTGITTGSRAELLSALSNSNNWSGSNSTRQFLSTNAFTLTAGGASGLSHGSGVATDFAVGRDAIGLAESVSPPVAGASSPEEPRLLSQPTAAATVDTVADFTDLLDNISFSTGDLASFSLFGTNSFNTSSAARNYVITHGYQSSADAEWVSNIGNAIKGFDAQANVILVDWEDGANPRGFFGFDYGQAAENTFEVGQQLGELLNALPVNPDGVQLIGHSLGGHVSGVAGDYYEDLTGRDFGVIVGMDPAGPAFEGPDLFNGFSTPSLGERLDATDAERVIAYHTSDTLGYDDRLGDLDLYVNPDDLFQPGQFSFVGNHGYAHTLYTQLVNGQTFAQPDGSVFDYGDQFTLAGSFNIETGA